MTVHQILMLKKYADKHLAHERQEMAKARKR